MTGIYGIYNKVTGKWYVGQSVDIERRNSRERYNLGRGFFHWGTGDNPHLVAAWQKYGPAAFEWVVLEECPVECLDDREVYWIAQKDSYKNGYNRTLGGGGVRGYQATAETRRKLSENHADMRGPNNPMYGKKGLSGPASPHWGKSPSDATRQKMRDNHADIHGGNNPRARPVAQYDATGQLVRVWDCVTDAARALGINHRNISAVCLGHRKTAGGYAWAHIDKREVQNGN